MNEIHTNVYTSTAGTAGTNGNIFKTIDGALIKQQANILDIACIVPQPDGDSSLTKEIATGIPMCFSYTKPASDWKLYVGEYGARQSADGTLDSSFAQQSATGIENPTLRYHNFGTAGDTVPEAVTVAVEAKNYLDVDPMIYNLVVSGADGHRVTGVITGTVMDSGPFNVDGVLDNKQKVIYEFPEIPPMASI